MRGRIVRAVCGISVGANTGPVEPRFNVAAFPNAAAGMLRASLSCIISPLGKLRPVERKAAADKPFAEIGAAGRTRRDRSSVLIQVHRHAVDRTLGNEGVKIIRGLSAATILQTVVAAAQLGALRCVDPPKPDPRAVNLQCVAVDGAGLPNQVTSQGWAPKGKKRQEGSRSSGDHCFNQLQPIRYGLLRK
jgi:hypothetical protein